NISESVSSQHRPSSCDVPHLHNLILQLRQEVVDNLVLLDRERVEVDLLHALDLAELNETAELGDRLPFLLLALASTAASTAPSTSASAVTSTTTITAAGSESTTSCCVGHIVDCRGLVSSAKG